MEARTYPPAATYQGDDGAWGSAAKPTTDLDAASGQGFMQPDHLVAIVNSTL